MPNFKTSNIVLLIIHYCITSKKNMYITKVYVWSNFIPKIKLRNDVFNKCV